MCSSDLGDEEEDTCTLGDEHLSRDLPNALGKKGITAGPASPGGARPVRRARKPRSDTAKIKKESVQAKQKHAGHTAQAEDR